MKSSACLTSEKTLELLREHELFCPKCGYCLRHANQCECPECGVVFRMGLQPILPSMKFWLSMLIPQCLLAGLGILLVIMLIKEGRPGSHVDVWNNLALFTPLPCPLFALAILICRRYLLGKEGWKCVLAVVSCLYLLAWFSFFIFSIS